MTSTTKPAAHTPTPWFVNSSAGDTSIWSRTIDNKIARVGASYRADADAAFIVRAVNAHADLIAALNEARNALTDLNIVRRPILDRIDAALKQAGNENG